MNMIIYMVLIKLKTDLDVVFAYLVQIPWLKSILVLKDIK